MMPSRICRVREEVQGKVMTVAVEREERRREKKREREKRSFFCFSGSRPRPLSIFSSLSSFFLLSLFSLSFSLLREPGILRRIQTRNLVPLQSSRSSKRKKKKPFLIDAKNQWAKREAAAATQQPMLPQGLLPLPLPLPQPPAPSRAPSLQGARAGSSGGRASFSTSGTRRSR